jgi:hypothetical protein
VIAISIGKIKNPASEAMMGRAIFAVRMIHDSFSDDFLAGGVLADVECVAEECAGVVGDARFMIQALG